jgi:hypothetical protein
MTNILIDNGLSADEQAEMDEKYETLMAEVKKIDLKLYKKLRDDELAGFIKDKEFAVVENNQIEMFK